MRRLVWALLLLLPACASSPKTQFFALEPVPPSEHAAQLSGTPVAVTALRLPPTLDRLQIVRRGQGNALDVSETDRWAAPLDEMARRVLIQDLELRAKPGVVVQPDMPQPKGDIRDVVVGVQRFDADASGKVELTCEWMLLSGSPPHPVLQRKEHIGVPGGPSQAAGMSTALGVLADRIVAELAKGR